MRLLVCGGRDYKNVSAVRHVLYAIHRKKVITCLIEGGATGADALAQEWARMVGIPVKTYPADWEKHEKAAGPIRNALMIEDGKPDGVVAFPGGRGTANMIDLARKAGIMVYQPRL
jgi:predicted Rossmann-fold nucleotide-binding protein